jgi:hypothetical protein
VKKTFSRGALLLTRVDGDDLLRLVSSDSERNTMRSVLIFLKSIKFGYSFSLHLVYFANDPKSSQKKTF